MKNFFSKFRLADLLIGLIIYFLLLIAFGWENPNASSSYRDEYNYGFPFPVVSKDVPTNFCPNPPCKERSVTYYPYESYSNISSIFIFSVGINIATILAICFSVSYARNKLLST